MSEFTEKIRPDKLEPLIKELRMAYYGTNSIEESYDIEKNSVKAKKMKVKLNNIVYQEKGYSIYILKYILYNKYNKRYGSVL